MFEWLLGKKTEKAIDTVAEGLYNGIDKLFFTDEEKVQASQKAFDAWLRMVEATSKENSAKSYTRRIIAIMVISVWLTLLVYGVVAFPFSQAYSRFILSLVTNDMLWITGAVVVFYFGPSVLNNIFRKS